MNLTQTALQLIDQKRNATRVFVVLAVAFLSGTLISGYFDYQAPAWQLHWHTGVYALLTLASLVGWWLHQQDRTELGIEVALTAIFILVPVTSLLVRGLGTALAVAIVAGALLINGLTLTRRHTTRVIVATGLSSLATLLLDIFEFPNRVLVPSLQMVVPILVGVFLVIFLVFIYRSVRSYSLRTKLLILLLASVLISTSLIAIGITTYTRATITSQVGVRVTELSGHLAKEIVSELEVNTQMLQALALNYVNDVSADNDTYAGSEADRLALIQARDRDWMNADNLDAIVVRVTQHPIAVQLRNFKRFAPNNVEVFLTDKYGANIAATDRTSDYYQGDEEWWQASYNNGRGAVYIGQPEFDESSNTFAIKIAVPVYNGGTAVGVLRTTLNIARIQGLLNAGQFGSSGEVVLRLANDSMLGTDQTLSKSDVDALAGLAAQKYGSINFLGAASLVSESKLSPSNSRVSLGQAISGLGWSVIVHQDVEEAFIPVTNATRVATLIALGVITAALLLGTYFAQWLSAPILSLTRTADQLAQGNLEARASVETSDEIGALAQAFNTMSGELQKLVGGLEKSVAERTFDLAQASRASEQRAQDLRSIAEVSAVIASEQKLEKLLPLIANLISEKFNFYHIGIFLLDTSGRYAVLQAASSQGGQRMLARNHRLEVGQTGLVGFVSQTGRARIALDVGADAIFFSNPDLPETRSEMALPLNMRGETIGVLDVQSEKAGAFSQSDIDTLSVLADQVAIAIDNARLFGEAQRTLAETQALYIQFLGQQWQGFLQDEKQVGYQQTLRGGEKLNSTITSADIDQAIKRGTVIVKNPSTEPAVMVIPVRLRNQVIGVLNVKALNPGQAWSPDEVNMVQSISDRLALTLETARLFQEAQRRATTERAIGDVATKLATAQDIDSILRLTAEELSKLLSNSKVAIQINREIGRMK